MEFAVAHERAGAGVGAVAFVNGKGVTRLGLNDARIKVDQARVRTRASQRICNGAADSVRIVTN